MKRLLLLVFPLLPALLHAQQLVNYVDPFIGTGGHGHVFPGATVPFGMVQLSPDNGDQGWDWCAGYHYSSHTIAGFSHTHLSGTGIGDWCDISVLPLADSRQLQDDIIKIPFSHDNEKASPGYYTVKLDNGVECELSASAHTGFHRYHFPASEGWLRFDLGFHINWDQPTRCEMELINDSTLVGVRYSTGWAKGQRVFFAARFSTPAETWQFIHDSTHQERSGAGPDLKMALKFKTAEPLLVRVGLSSVSTDKALEALKETEGRSFETVREQASQSWEKELEKIKINLDNRAHAVRFYTSLYRTCLAPVLYSDADGQYQNYDNTTHYFRYGKNYYNEFSQWDVFRALMPLFSITQPQRQPEILNSLMQFYEDRGLLPVWDLSTWETNTMSGYHSVPILADAILKGVKGIDPEKAYEAMRTSAFQKGRNTPDYIRYGYLPQDIHGGSVTITLEYAFDDWCIAQVARKLGKMDDYKLFMKRAMSYKNLFDPQTGFMRAKDSKGHFIEPFDPLLSEHGPNGMYIEGTAWQHSFFVPQDVQGLAALYGGPAKLVKKLDQLFNAPSVLHGENVSADVSGLIGQYAHGNEPSHHIIYMYTVLGHPEKAAHWLRIVADSMYRPGPDGLSGNDDCGQMSAWLVWTSLGLYPMNPASGEYVFGCPLVNSAEVKLPNGRKLTILVRHGKSKAREGIRAVQFNGKSIPVRSISHQQLLQGGQLIYDLYD